MTKKKVLILTQPLGHNYGGILQAYALQKVVHDLGYDVATNRSAPNRDFIARALRISKKLVFKLILNRPLPFILTARENVIISKNTNRFIEKHIQTTDIYKSRKYPADSTLTGLSAIIVGSDQVWRKAYSNVRTNLLDFAAEKPITRLAYAASFGRDDIDDYGSRLIKESARLARKFDAISVREDSGVEICKNYWGVNSTQLVDPTLLLKKTDYLQLIDSETKLTVRPKNKIFAYILDEDKGKREVLEVVSKELKLPVYKFPISSPHTEAEFYSSQNKYLLPPVSQWLAGFADSKFVVTDSFHGCVFSIMFNKPFVVVGNKSRGLARFSSLLKLFGLEERMVLDAEDINMTLLSSRVDWNSIREILDSEQKKSYKFLKVNLP